jgi:hypothetical protein
MDLSLPDPTDRANLDPADREALPPGSILQRHPYVRRLQREITRLRDENHQLTTLQREMVNRDVLAARYLEPLNPAPIGVIAPASLPTIIHVDNLRLLRNRVMREQDPMIRLLVGGPEAIPQHCRDLRLLGPSELRERYLALPRRSAALVVLETAAPIEVMR